jgi:hypothetical protein
MPLDLPCNDDRELRELMLDEVEYDVMRDNLYTSRKFNDLGNELYLPLLVDAIESGDDSSLAQALWDSACFEGDATRHDATVAAQDEMNRFCMRAISRKALDFGETQVEIYRARPSQNPRPESQQLVGTRVNAKKVLDGLRRNDRDHPVEGLGEPNSGLSVRLVKELSTMRGS